MPSLTVNAPDGASLNVNIPDGTPESSYPQIAQEAVDHYQALPGKLESFGRAAVNNLPFGGQMGAAGTALLNNQSDSEGMKAWNDKAQDAKDTNPISYGAGAVAGTLAPMALPVVGEAIEGAPVASGMALGALNATGNTDLTKEPGKALKQGVTGAVIGGLGGKLAQSLTPEASKIEDLASEKGVQALNLRPGMLGHLDPEEVKDIGHFAREADLLKGSTQERLDRALSLRGQVGAQIQSLGNPDKPITDLTEFIEPLQEKAKDSAKFFGSEGNSDLNTYRQGIANLQNNGFNFDQLQKLKTVYGEKAFDANHMVKDTAAADVWGQIKSAIQKTIDESPEEYQDTLTAYKHLNDISEGLQKQLGVERAGGSGPGGFGVLGAIRRLPPGLRYPIGAAGALTGHPILAAGAVLPELSNPNVHSKVLQGVADNVDKIGSGLNLTSNNAVSSYLLNTLTTNPKKFGRFAQPLLQAARTGGSQGLAVQHFLLSQQHPDYNKMVMEQDTHEPE